MRFTIDPWDPGYGTSAEAGVAGPDGTDGEEIEVTLDAEIPPSQWRPIRPEASPTGHVTVVDGVRRVEARLWIDTAGGGVPGVCASWAAGSVRCGDGTALLQSIEIGRALAAPLPDGLLDPIVTRHGTYEPVQSAGPNSEQQWIAVQDVMGRAERRIAEAAMRASPTSVVLVDGPLRGRDHLAGVAGLVKTHHVRYLAGAAAEVLPRLEPGERTPVFTIGGGFTRHSWYLRLPSPHAAGVPMGGVVRCEAPVSIGSAQLTEFADRVSVETTRLASEPHKDRRAPQNLYPISGLERLLRHRLGDAQLLYRALRLAASA